MKKNRMLIYGAGTFLVLAMFVGCGGNKGEKEYEKAMQAWSKGGKDNLVQARVLFEKSIGRLSGNDRKSTAYNNLGRVLWQLNETTAAATAFDNACTLSETVTDATLNLAIAQFHAGELDAAERSFGAYLGKNPDHESAQAMLGLVAGEKQDWAQASRLIGRLVASNPADPAGRNALILTQFNQDGSASRAETSMIQLIQEHPDYSPAYYNLAVLYDQYLQDTEQARTNYRAYLNKAGDGGSHAEQARQALERLNRAVTATADPAAAMQFLAEGDRLYRAGQYSEALTQFQKAVEANPANKEIHYYAGLTYFKLQKYNDAITSCTKALRIDPDYGDARYTLAYSYAQLRSWNDAEREAMALAEVDAKRGNDMLEYIKNARN